MLNYPNSVGGGWTAIILAGQRPGPDHFSAAYGVDAKALIPVAGAPMLGHVARALLASPSIGRILVLAQSPGDLLKGSLDWMAAEPRIRGLVTGDGISLSIDQVAGADPAPFPLLVTTADHPLLTPEIVEAFIAGAQGSDAAYGAVERQVAERAWPGMKRTWVKLSDGHFTGANLFALTAPRSRRAVQAWADIEKDRKRALRLLFYLGPTILLRALTRTISLDRATAASGRKIGIDLRAVRLPFADAAIDVDKPSDLVLAEHILMLRANAAERKSDSGAEGSGPDHSNGV
ncbi:nucleotidyltransferase family protein [Sphingosinicella rhizophila]|uniref:Nucleotidyltransferase family protein n=1 Tax=Sphingosinicella rhizophila TaxID=3050082 RepID=A0ABU3QC41_9SPHN|nr:nucleotidyltransferase family protein [Sphingosinicella sp. GR2756]MDT9600954.1 nucleotidyltransferase family protein [Sphingosinicella sp. GR2756]